MDQFRLDKKIMEKILLMQKQTGEQTSYWRPSGKIDIGRPTDTACCDKPVLHPLYTKMGLSRAMFPSALYQHLAASAHTFVP